MTNRPTRDQVRRAPKVLLHDHLDGGLRPQTVVELADECGHELPEAHQDAESLGTWFRGVGRLRLAGALPRDLRPHRRRDADRRRTARVAARVRRGPGRRRRRLRRGPLRARAAPRGRARRSTRSSRPCTPGSARATAAAGRPDRGAAAADRHAARGPLQEIAELAVAYRDRGVAGFDIAGAEAGFPPTRHLDAFEYLRRENAHFTIHAGEAFGLPRIWEAIQWCGADRLGHGVRIVDDITVDDDGDGRRWAGWRHTSATSASRWRCARAPTSRPARPTSIAEHPIALLKQLRFRVTVNTDNRLMSGTSMTGEMGRSSRRSAGPWTTCAGSRSTR